MRSSSLFLSCGLLIFITGCIPFIGSRRPLPPIDNTAQPSAAFHSPLKNPKLLSPFGQRGRRFHTGIDIRNKRGGGDPVLAARNGKVIWVGRKKGYGKLISLRHPDGFLSRYAHLKKYRVKKGQAVKRGQVIGVVGDSGRASTEHLHFEILTPQHRFKNPAPLIFKK